MTLPRLAVIGTGRMGRMVEQVAMERGWPIVAVIGAAGNESGNAITRESLAGAEVAIEFTLPDAAAANVRACVRAGCPVVSGTTGWEHERDAVQGEVLAAGGALLWSANFSLGANVLWEAAAFVARLASHIAGVDARIIEMHHAGKRDAPSGTAQELERLAAHGLGRAIPITSIRLGSVPGVHELLFDAPYEQIRLAHEVRDRRVFADGALSAAAWLVGRTGVFTLRDVLANGNP